MKASMRSRTIAACDHGIAVKAVLGIESETALTKETLTKAVFP
jgi:hypothetical protein